jgi:hypothetical protein
MTKFIYIGHLHATHVHIGIIEHANFLINQTTKAQKYTTRVLGEQFVKFTLSENKAKVTNLVGNFTIYI